MHLKVYSDKKMLLKVCTDKKMLLKVYSDKENAPESILL